jgi:cold shock CspA family protein/ribosome-associated translation inhibitor RaiA
MKPRLQITFRNMQPSELVEEWIGEEAAKLETFYSQLMACHVVIEVPHRHHREGIRYHTRIDLTVPGEHIVVKRAPRMSSRARQLGESEIKKHSEVEIAHKDLRLTIDDAFKAAGRRLQDFARRQRGDVKSHALLPEARVSKILPSEGYGFLTSDDGREIYFHKNCVQGGRFPHLKVGTTVTFVEEPGEKGPQASTVRIVPKQGSREAANAMAVPD